LTYPLRDNGISHTRTAKTSMEILHEKVRVPVETFKLGGRAGCGAKTTEVGVYSRAGPPVAARGWGGKQPRLVTHKIVLTAAEKARGYKKVKAVGRHVARKVAVLGALGAFGRAPMPG